MNRFDDALRPGTGRAKQLLAGGCAVLLLAAANTAFGGNRTFTGMFTGNEPTMPSTLSSCAANGLQSLGYVEAGTFSVDTTGEYRIIDAGNIGFGGVAGIQDASVILYEGSFDPANPSANREAAVDVTFDVIGEEPFVFLDAGTDYVMVIQHWCDFTAGAGPWGVVMQGPGSFSGIGFASDPNTTGNWSNVTDTTVFGVGQAGTDVRKYQVVRSFTPERSGQYAFVDVSEMYGIAPSAILVYEGDFDPNDPSAGFLADVGFGGVLQLDAGTAYSVVMIDAFFENSRFQSVLFPAGQPGLGEHMNGAWFDPMTSGQGVLFDYGPNTAGGFLFLAWFTFDTANDSGVQSVGDGTQRWLTGSGMAGTGTTELDIMFANTSGGRFNERADTQSTDGEYGVGTVTVNSCDAIDLDFELPDGNTGSVSLGRGLPREIDRCYEQSGVGPLIR